MRASTTIAAAPLVSGGGSAAAADAADPTYLSLVADLASEGTPADGMAERVRIVHAGKRDVAPQSLEAAASATMRRQRLSFVHFNRQSGERLR